MHTEVRHEQETSDCDVRHCKPRVFRGLCIWLAERSVSVEIQTGQRVDGRIHRRKHKTASVSSLLKRKSTPEELSPEFKAAQKNFKDPEKSLLAWARYQEDIGEYAEARKKYRELQIAYPNNIEASLGLARIEMLTGRTRQAEEQLLTLAKDHPENGDIQLELGAMYSRAKISQGHSSL